MIIRESVKLNQFLFSKIILFIGIILIGLLALSEAKSQGSLKSSQGIVAIVNSDIITRFDLISRINFILFLSKLSNNEKVIKRIRPQVITGLINDKLKLQAARKLKIKVSESDLATAINEVEKNNRIPKGQMVEFLRKNRINYQTFKVQMEAQVAWRKVILKKVRSSVKISRDSINETIEEIRANKGKPEFLVSEIFLPFNNKEPNNVVYQNAMKLFLEAKKGGNFAALARSFSQSASAANGGNSGWIRAGQVDKNLAEIIAQLTPNGISNPVKGEDGYYIIKLRKKRKSAGLTESNVKLTIEQIFFPTHSASNKLTIERITKKAEQITGSLKTCNSMSEKGKELDSKNSGRIKVDDISKLPRSIQNIVIDIPLNKASVPIVVSSGVIVLMVCNRSDGQITNQTRNQIRGMLLMKRAELLERSLLRDIKRAAFLEIRR